MDPRLERIVETVSVDVPRQRDRKVAGLVEPMRHLPSILGFKH